MMERYLLRIPTQAEHDCTINPNNEFDNDN
jgi:hypothetical protein